MTREVDQKLHSAAPVVMIEAAGGCGKTTKAAKYAGEAAASVHQHETVRLLREIGGARLRIFGDPMQAIHPANDDGYVDWDALWAAADDTGLLEEPHRWAEAPELGQWVMASRIALKAGNPVSLRGAPAGVSAVSHNELAGRERFRDIRTASRLIHGFLDDAPDSAAILAFIGNMAKSTAQAGNWRAPLKEGAQLDELDVLLQSMEAQAGNRPRSDRALDQDDQGRGVRYSCDWRLLFARPYM